MSIQAQVESRQRLLLPARDAATQQLVEIERGRLIRPELFHTRDVSGVAVPVFALKGGQAKSIWTTHLRWSDGRREALVLDKDWIEIGDGNRLWIHPKPAGPAPGMFPTWSEQSRQLWRDTLPRCSVASTTTRGGLICGMSLRKRSPLSSETACPSTKASGKRWP